MPTSSPVIDKEIETTTNPDLLWKVILFNCNCHTFDDVIEQLMKAIVCSSATASQLAHVADQFDSVQVYEGDKVDCQRVADILGATGLIVQVTN